MEYSFSSCNEETFDLEFSDDEYDRMGQTDHYGYKEQVQRYTKKCDSSQIMHYNSQLKLENNNDIKDLRLHQIQESETLALPKHSPEKTQTTSTDLEKDEMVNVPKLIHQLLNAKVVIEKMFESSGKDLMPDKKRVLPNGSRFKDFVQRYCPKCKTLEYDKNGVTLKKFCPRCETTLKYACSKCNGNQYPDYQNMKRHWIKCGSTADRYKIFNPFDFLVKKTNIDYSKEILRYCLRCNKINENCPKWKEEVCRNCSHRLLYQCNKCKVQYHSYKCLRYHLQSQCYPSQYKCNQCNFTNSTWAGMRQHVNYLHFGTKMNCPRCDRLFTKVSIRMHLKNCGSKAKFNCNNCAFNTKYKGSLQSHMKTVHGK